MEHDSKKQTVSKITNTNSEKYIAQKFHREFDRTIHDMFHGLEEGTDVPDDLRLNYIRFKELLMKLGMISELTHATAVAIDTQESNLIIELW